MIAQSTQLDEGLALLDLEFQGLPEVIGSFAFHGTDGFGLVEIGPTTTLDRLLTSIEAFGGLDRLTAVVVTHVHLDHAGGVGKLLRMAPSVRCFVHRVGAPHLVEPSKLLASAKRIYGDDMERLWGEVVPAPESQVAPVEDGDRIELGGTSLRVVYTPGHASHHIALYDEERSALLTGDAAGVRLDRFFHVRPPTPPPDVDLDEWKRSVQKMLDLEPDRLLLTHFGVQERDLPEHFEQLLDRLKRWAGMVREGMIEGVDRNSLVDRMRAEGDEALRAAGGSDVALRQYELANPYGMSVDGLIRYWERPPGGTPKA